MSTEVRGNCSTNTTLANASEITFEISTDLRSGPGRFRSVTLNGAMLYRHCTRAFVGSGRWRGWAPRGPYTAARTLLFPHSMYADPSAFFRTPASIRIGRSSSARRPSSRIPFSSISFSFFSMCSTSSMSSLSAGVRRPPPVRGLQVLPHEIREPCHQGLLLDQVDDVRDVPPGPRVAVDPDPAVLPHEHPGPRHVPDHRDHASLLPDQAGDLRVGDLEDLPAREPPELALRQAELDPLRLVDGEDLREDRVAHPQVALRVPELHPPRRLRRVEGRGGRRVDVPEPVGGAGGDDLADDDVPRAGDVDPAERNHVHVPLRLGADAEQGGVDVAPLGKRPRTRLQSVSIEEVARDHNLSARGAASLHWVLISLTRACEREQGLKPLPPLEPRTQSEGAQTQLLDRRDVSNT